MTVGEINKVIKGVFKPMREQYYIGRLKYGTPYFWPINFSSTIIKLRKLKLNPQEVVDSQPNEYCKKAKKFSNLPMIRRSKSWIFKILGNYYLLEIGWPIKVAYTHLGWKDKFGTPRFEWNPMWSIFFFNWQFCIHWMAPDGDNDNYFESILWYCKYSDCDIDKARKTWDWVNSIFGNKYLL